MAGGLQKVIMSDATEISCGGINKYSDEIVNTFSGGVEGKDIEAIIQNDVGEILIGGGVWGSGYFGIIKESSSLKDNFSETDLIQLSPIPVAQLLNIESITEQKNRKTKYY